MQINLLSPMRLSALFLPQMIERSSGHIVNISSLAGWIGSPFLSAYCASKFGLRGFSESLAPDLRPHNIRGLDRVSLVQQNADPGLRAIRFRAKTYRSREHAESIRPTLSQIIAGVRKNKAHISGHGVEVIALHRAIPPGAIPRCSDGLSARLGAASCRQRYTATVISFRARIIRFISRQIIQEN